MKRFHEIKAYRFDGLVHNYRKFGIPNFQRAYKWGAKQITDFFSVLDSNECGYFIGNIVCVTPSTATQDRLLVIDGQQRLTTISLFLVALRDYADKLPNKPSGGSDIVGWINEYLKDKDKRERQEYFILKPAKDSFAQVLADIIERTTDGKKYDKAQLAYIRGYQTLLELISQRVKGDLDRLNILTEKVLQLELVVIVLESDNGIFDTFEGLNSRGLGLSVSDLVKNNLFSHAESLHCLERVEQLWLEIETDFEQVNPEWLPKFLRHTWISRNGYITGKDLFDAVKKEIVGQRTADELQTLCSNWREDSKFYLGIRTGIFGHYLKHIDPVPRKIVESFRILENQQVYEVLLALNRKMLTDRAFKPKYFRDIAQIFWNFCLRTQYLAVSPSLYEKLFADYCKLIQNSPSALLLNKSKQMIQKLRMLTKNRDEFVETIVSELSYQSNAPLVEHLLAMLVEHSEKGRIQHTVNSIEHIVPQEPKEWGLTKRVIKDYVHTLGNLTLLHPKDNEKARNRKIDDKCKLVYSKSHFAFNKDIYTSYQKIFQQDWKSAIELRGKDMAQNIYTEAKL